MDKGLMVLALVENFTGGNRTKFAKMLGVQAQTISAWIARKTFDAELIYTKCRNISADWLLTGEGPMLQEDNDQKVDGFQKVGREIRTDLQTTSDEDMKTIYKAYLLPMSAMGGSLTGFAADGVTAEQCEQIISPVADVDFAITIYGDSMAPEYPSGCRVLIKKIDAESYIAWGNVYVLDTTNGVIIKEVQPGADDTCIQCISANPSGKYKPFGVPKKDIYSVYRIVACITAK